jgi:diaminopimelate epimerase
MNSESGLLSWKCCDALIASAATGSVVPFSACPTVAVMTAGGDELRVGLEAEGGGQRVTLSGPAEVAFDGTWTEGV